MILIVFFLSILIAVALITFLIPIIYSYFDKYKIWRIKRKIKEMDVQIIKIDHHQRTAIDVLKNPPKFPELKR